MRLLAGRLLAWRRSHSSQRNPLFLKTRLKLSFPKPHFLRQLVYSAHTSPRGGNARNCLWHFEASGGWCNRVRAVVLMHGCSGITGAETYWGTSLPQLGVATLVVNSFVARSITNVCMGPDTISIASVLTDVYRARDLLAAHPRIDPGRIALMGFSSVAARLSGQATYVFSNATIVELRALQRISRFIPTTAISSLPMKIALVTRRSESSMALQTTRRSSVLQGVRRQAARRGQRREPARIC